MKLHNTALKSLYKKSKKGHQGFPLATLAFYGPSNIRATKIVISIIETEGGKPSNLKKWTTENGDIRIHTIVGKEICNFVQSKKVVSIVIADGIIGCPHEEGIDYPEGVSCPSSECTYWVGRNRFSHNIEH